MQETGSGGNVRQKAPRLAGAKPKGTGPSSRKHYKYYGGATSRQGVRMESQLFLNATWSIPMMLPSKGMSARASWWEILETSLQFRYRSKPMAAWSVVTMLRAADGSSPRGYSHQLLLRFLRVVQDGLPGHLLSDCFHPTEIHGAFDVALTLSWCLKTNSNLRRQSFHRAGAGGPMLYPVLV